jgi:hypothetical protein
MKKIIIIILILLLLIIYYYFYKNINENFNNDIVSTHILAIKNLSDLASTLIQNGSLTVPGGLNINGEAVINKLKMLPIPNFMIPYQIKFSINFGIIFNFIACIIYCFN